MKILNFVFTGLFIAMVLFIGVSLQPANNDNRIYADGNASFLFNEKTIENEKIVVLDNNDSLTKTYIIYEFDGDICNYYLFNIYFNTYDYNEALNNNEYMELVSKDDENLCLEYKTGFENVSYENMMEQIQGLIDSGYYLLIK